jgi:hypothetical protein
MSRTEERELLATNVRADDRNRVSLGRALENLEDVTFTIYRDASGRIILEPHVSVPLAEAWLFRNQGARDSVARGLKQLGSAKPGGSFAKFVDDEA